MGAGLARPRALPLGGEALLKLRGVEVIVLDDAESYKLMQDFIVAEPTLWNEDIGEEDQKNFPICRGWEI